MRTIIFTFSVAMAVCLLSPAPVRAQKHDGPMPYSWSHAHRHTCIEYSEYPWTRCQAHREHDAALANPYANHSCETGPACSQHRACGGPSGCAPKSVCGGDCGGCGHGHCSSRHMFEKNCNLITGLRGEYCIPQSAVESLCRQNEAAWHACRMYPQGTCFQCAPPSGYGCKPSLQQVHVELQSLKSKCFVQAHR